MVVAKKARIVFLITEDSLNYEVHKIIPVFADKLRKDYGYEVAVLLGSGPHGACRYPDINKINDASLLVVFSRRIAIPQDQMTVFKNYLKASQSSESEQRIMLLPTALSHHQISAYEIKCIRPTLLYDIDFPASGMPVQNSYTR